MSISLYKPNSKNTGCGFSFQGGLDNKTKETTLYIKAIKQHSWDSNKKQGYFSKNAKDPDKNIIVKFNEFECGEIISAIKNRREYSTFHSFGEDKTIIKISPWDKKSKKSFKNPDTDSWEEKWVTIPAFSISFTRNGNQTFGVGIEPGEAECICQYLSFILNKIFENRFEKDISRISNKDGFNKNPERDIEIEPEREEAPF
tara:strand:- start:353 stop:955 length:603 start_codon:yes stop_codon:yes gene_type:complete